MIGDVASGRPIHNRSGPALQGRHRHDRDPRKSRPTRSSIRNSAARSELRTAGIPPERQPAHDRDIVRGRDRAPAAGQRDPARSRSFPREFDNADIQELPTTVPTRRRSIQEQEDRSMASTAVCPSGSVNGSRSQRSRISAAISMGSGPEFRCTSPFPGKALHGRPEHG